MQASAYSMPTGPAPAAADAARKIFVFMPDFASFHTEILAQAAVRPVAAAVHRREGCDTI